MITNWFMAVMAVLNVGAGVVYIAHGDTKMGLIVFCYAVSSGIFATM